MNRAAISFTNSIVNIIVNTIAPYSYEINNILALPNGATYRARYRNHWCPTIQGPSEIVQREGLIILREWSTGVLIPLRHVRVDTVDLVGDIYHIYYTLRDLVEFSGMDEDRAEQIRRFNQQMQVELQPYDNNGGTDLQKLVFLAPDLTANFADSKSPTDQTQRENNNWGKIVELIGRFDCFIDVDFLRIIGLRHESGKYAKWQAAHGQNRYGLTNERNYTLEIYQRAIYPKIGDSSVTKRDLRLRADSDSAQIVQGQFSITGKYERYLFRFRTYNRGHVKDANLLLDIERSDNKGPIPTIAIPIRILTSTTRTAIAVLALCAFILGTIFLFAGDQIVSSIPAISADLAKSIGILIMILSAPTAKEFVFGLIDHTSFGVRR